MLQEILTNNTETSSRLRLAEQYQALVLCFSKEIAIINRYNDQKIDKRETQLIDLAQYMNTSKIMSESVESVKESAQYNQSQGEPESPSDTMQTDLALATPSMAAKCKRDKQLKQARDLLIEEIKTLAEELNRLIKKTKNLQDTQALIALQGIKLKLRPKLVELAFFPDITPADNRLLKNVTEKIKGTLDVLDSFKDAVKLGDVVRVIQLYPHVQSENLTPIFCDFVVNQLVISKEEKVKNLIRIADYFYQNSHCYREEISAFNHVVTPICNNIKCSVLFMAFLQKNYLAFELLLTQGFSPNGIGLVWEDETIASIINTVVYFMGRNLASYNDVRYIEKLLNLGALVDLKPPKLFMVLSVSKDAESFTKIIQENLKKAVRPEKTSTQSSKPSASLKELDDPLGVTDLKKHLKSHHSALEILCVLTELPKIELLTCLAPHSGLSSLMNAFSFLANRPEVSSKLIIGTSKKCFIACPNKKLADETSEKLFPYQKNVSLIVYQTNAQKGDAFLKSINVVINAVFKQYREIVQNDPEHITVLYALLIEKAKKGSDLDERAHFYLSALYLQLLNSTSSFEDTQKIVQTLYFLGNEYHVASQNQYAQYYFQKAVDCCQKLENSEKLQATSLYQDLQTGLESGVIFLPKETQTLMVTLQNLWPSLVLETPGGSPITPAAVIHATQGPSLTELANAELPPQALLASTQVNLKKKKKLRNGV
ncbi:MAG TPA: hypothetical protein VGU44_00255 [Gammaproteobacteria bacterium]|nr:hypothetical protein [Gammaproteobacteria bacterium]